MDKIDFTQLNKTPEMRIKFLDLGFAKPVPEIRLLNLKRKKKEDLLQIVKSTEKVISTKGLSKNDLISTILEAEFGIKREKKRRIWNEETKSWDLKEVII